jgi:hypothetical protein
VDTRPKYDAAGRTVIYTVLSVTLEFYVLAHDGDPDQDTNAKMRQVRNLLTQPAAALRLSGAGFGELDVNRPGGGGQRDVVWGPKPQMLSEVYKGGERAWLCTWRVDVAILDQCPPGTARWRFAAMEFNFRMTYAVGFDGLQTRTYSGHLKIPQTRMGRDNRTLEDNADKYRERIVPPMMPDYRRRPGTFSLSEDKCTLFFEIVDEQLPSWAPPIFCYEPPALSHACRSSLKDGLVIWSHRIQGDYSVVKGRPRQWAWEHFSHYVDKVRNEILRRAPGSLLLTQELGLADPDVYGRRSGSMHYVFTQTPAAGAAALNLARAAGGDAAQLRALLALAVRSLSVWTEPGTSPLDGPGAVDDWAKWNQSMTQALANSPRGMSQLRFDNGDDAIVDLCMGNEPRMLTPAAPPGLVPQLERVLQGNPPPNRFNSWLRYDLWTEAVQSDGTALHVLLPTERELRTAQPAGQDVDDAGGHLPGNYVSAPEHVTQLRSAPVTKVALVGRALRVGYDITPPKLFEYMGVPVVPIEEGSYFRTRATTITDGNVVISASWRLFYALTRLPTLPVKATGTPMTGPLLGSSPGSTFVISTR